VTLLRRICGLCLLVTGCLLLAGCARRLGQANAEPPPAEVQVSIPIIDDVTDYEEFPGRTEPVYSIDVRARVTGHLLKTHFKDGAEVKQGDLLFEIDPRIYKADLASAEANLVQARARFDRLTSDFSRARELLIKKAIGQEEYDKISGDRAEASAAAGKALADRDRAQQMLNYTQIRSDIDGRISRRYIDPGNLVKADDTVLTTIVSLEPMYVYFDVDERATLRVKQLAREGKLDMSPEAKQPMFVGLADERGFPRKGLIDFLDNRIDPDTGTWRVRGVFDNADRSLTSGLFVRVHLPIGNPYRALLVAEQALGADQGERFVYIVGEDDKARYQRVEVGRLQRGRRVITAGIKPGEQVVVSGLQRVRRGAKVHPTVVPMPKPEEPVTRDAESSERSAPPKPEGKDKETGRPEDKKGKP
jgi:RND family efflux transporter MFP subunit